MNGEHSVSIEAKAGSVQGASPAVRVSTDALHKYAALLTAPSASNVRRGSTPARTLGAVAALGASAGLPELTSAWLLVLELSAAVTPSSAQLSSAS
jgi:hypothetical protein